MQWADWKSIPVYMMDFEGSPASGVVEYGIVRLEKGAIHLAETDLCAPVGPISQRDEEVHGILEGDTGGKKPFSELYGEFVEFRRTGIFAAHNRHAENTFIKDTWALPPEVPDWRVGTAHAQEWGPWIDTLGIYKRLYPGLESYALGDLVTVFRLGPRLENLALRHCPEARRKPHCALFDALASALLLLRLEEEQSLAGSISVQWLLRISEGLDGQQELF